uniref:Uncharacterized protein n=1 Tax=Picocystis salinarum TaxID=88271 RepID=A0A7S3UAT2_9CHLO
MWRTLRTIYHVFRESGTLDAKKLRRWRLKGKKEGEAEWKALKAVQMEEEKLVLAEVRKNIESLLHMQKNMQEGERRAVEELEKMSKKAVKVLKEERKGQVEDMVLALQQELRVPGSKVARFIFDESMDNEAKKDKK